MDLELSSVKNGFRIIIKYYCDFKENIFFILDPLNGNAVRSSMENHCKFFRKSGNLPNFV